MKNPKDIVREGYNKVSFSYREDNPDKSSDSYNKYKSWIEKLSGQLNPGCSVLELGCGCGVPTTQLLTQHFKVTGVDISPIQVERARKLVPGASFICDDISELSFSSETYDAIVCLYTIIHIPVAEQQEILENIGVWLKPKGLFLLSAGEREWTGKESNWLGVDGGDMYWSHTNRVTYIKWLKQTGFQVMWDRFVPEGNDGHSLILSRKN